MFVSKRECEFVCLFVCVLVCGCRLFRSRLIHSTANDTLFGVAADVFSIFADEAETEVTELHSDATKTIPLKFLNRNFSSIIERKHSGLSGSKKKHFEQSKTSFVA